MKTFLEFLEDNYLEFNLKLANLDQLQKAKEKLKGGLEGSSKDYAHQKVDKELKSRIRIPLEIKPEGHSEFVARINQITPNNSPGSLLRITFDSPSEVYVLFLKSHGDKYRLVDPSFGKEYMLSTKSAKQLIELANYYGINLDLKKFQTFLPKLKYPGKSDSVVLPQKYDSID